MNSSGAQQNKFNKWSSFSAGRGRLARRLISGIVLFGVVITLCATAVQLYLEYTDNIERIEIRFREIEQSYLKSIIENVWLVDIERLEILADGIRFFPDFQYTEVLDEDGQLLVSSGNFGGTSVITRNYDLTYEFRGSNMVIGKLTVSATLSGVYRRLLNQMWIILASYAFIITLAAIIIYFFLYRIMTRHLEHMAAYARNLKIGHLNKPIFLDYKNKHQGDEIWELADAFNSMIKRLGKSMESLEKEILDRQLAEEEVRRLNEGLEEIIEARTHDLFEANTLLEQQRLFQEAVLENIQDGIVACDKDGILTVFNRATRLIHDIKEENLPPDQWANHYSLYMADGTTPMETGDIPLYRAYQGKMIKDDEMVIVPRAGKPRTVLASGRAMFDNHGNRLGAVISLHDITERKQTEKALQEAVKNAETANRAKSIFLANMSHEIRTPMNAILGFTEILKKKISNPGYSHYLEAIESSGKSLLNLINDILDLSRIEAGKLKLELTSVSLKSFFMEMETLFKLRMQDKGIELLIEISPELPETLLLDETRLRQSLVNLISNAVKFTDSGYIKISACLSFPDEPHQSTLDLTISIEDSGKGIPADQKEVIFDAFTQSKGQKVSIFGGAGLGLSITRRLIEMMNGRITVESKVGKGSTFAINLSNVEVASIKILSGSRENQIDTDSIQFRESTILIADDIEYNRELLKAILEDYNFTFIEAENGSEVIELARQHSPDLILLDIKMPEMDGFEAAEILGNDENLKKIPIIAITASALKNEEKELRDVFPYYLLKPVSSMELILSLMKVLPHTVTGVVSSDKVSEESIVAPAAGFLKKLYDLATFGDMSEFHKYVEKLKQIDSSYLQFAIKVDKLAYAFKINEILEFIEKYEGKK